MSIITLLTDFGMQDEYVGVIKGVIYGINPKVKIVDLSHAIKPRDVLSAGYLLKSSYSFFPQGTIHMAVVDPGVGSRRNILAADISGHLFLAPDNGLLGPVLAKESLRSLVVLDTPDLYRQPVSGTFHGRDIFAPVAAHLSLGMSVDKLGRPLKPGEMNLLPGTEPAYNDQGMLCGSIVRVDHFGNLITNLELAQLVAKGFWEDPDNLVVQVKGANIKGIQRCYADSPAGSLLVVLGSSNCLEIAVSMGSAANKLKVQSGACVLLSKKK
jgi:S-adenosylmethionine hydrolase